MAETQAESTRLALRSGGTGISIDTLGSELGVFNEDSATVTGDSDDPFGTETNVIVHTVPDGATYLDLYHTYRGTGDPATFPVVRVFGRIPRFDGLKGGDRANQPGHRLWAQDVDADHSSLDERWIPLTDPSDNSVDQTFTAAVLVESANHRMSAPQQIYLGGCDRVRVHIVTAANGGTFTEGLIEGRFVS